MTMESLPATGSNRSQRYGLLSLTREVDFL